MPTSGSDNETVDTRRAGNPAAAGITTLIAAFIGFMFFTITLALESAVYVTPTHFGLFPLIQGLCVAVPIGIGVFVLAWLIGVWGPAEGGESAKRGEA